MPAPARTTIHEIPMEKPLSPEIIARLGTISDRLLAAEAGVNPETIRRARQDRKLPGTRRQLQWTDAMDAVLGTDTDENIGVQVGVSRMAVTLRRHRKGVPPYTVRKMSYLKEDIGSTTGVVTLTAHVSEEVRKKAEALRRPLLALYHSSGLPMRDITMWQVMEYAVNKLHKEMVI